MKIINIIPHPPAYNSLNSNKPTIYWEVESNNIIGFDPWDWSDLLGEQVLLLNKTIQYEVWQPDYKAKKIYERDLKTGIKRKLFPCYQKKYDSFFCNRYSWFSDEMFNQIESFKDQKIIIHLNNWRDHFTIFLLNYFKDKSNIIFFVSGHGGPFTPLEQIKITKNPFKMIKLIQEHLKLKSFLNRIDFLSDQNKKIISILENYTKRKVETLTMGIDFNFWKPCPTPIMKKQLRQKYDINDNQLVLLSACNLIPRKQIDYFLNTLEENQNVTNFKYILVGRGSPQYLDYIKQVGKNLIASGKFIIYNYAIGEALRELFWISDLYVSVSTIEGASVSVMQAMACGIPVFSSDTGGTMDFMRELQIPTVVPKYKYSVWQKELNNILKNDKTFLKSVPIDLARERYHWPNVAKKFLNIYDELWNN
jgi:glycosyltransferase involved in cell wall biosynthesis